MKTQGFTLIELLAVIVILAIIALIATPIVLGIIDDTKESAQIRSSEMYLKGVSNAVMKENLEQEGNFKPTECSITDKGNLYCDDNEEIIEIEVEVDGEKPKNGKITFEEGKIKEVILEYQNSTIVKNEEGNLVYSDEGSDSGSGELDLSTVNTDLATNTWEDVYKVVKAGKVAKAGWSVGDNKTLTINGHEKEATLIGINHDGDNTATFMVMSDIGSSSINNEGNLKGNIGGWEASDIRSWLNNDIYNSMTNIKDYIKSVDKLTNNVGYSSTSETIEATVTSDKVFLLSAVEVGLGNHIWSDYSYLGVFNSEGAIYDWFKTNLLNNNEFWLRSPDSVLSDHFFYYRFGSLDDGIVYIPRSILPAFVIGE